MTGKTSRYRDALRELSQRTEAMARDLEETARTPLGSEGDGGLSHAPMHLADQGSETYAQELSAALMENEKYIAAEAEAALARIEAGTFGACEECGQRIPEGRLDALPYTRYCVGCAALVGAGSDTNLNRGRPVGWGSTLEHPSSLASQKRAGEQSPTVAKRKEADADSHAAGTPGGGSAAGGLAGSNAGDGDPMEGGLEAAMASGRFDVADESDEAEDGAYAGATGGAVGGSPANKRTTGGRE